MAVAVYDVFATAGVESDDDTASIVQVVSARREDLRGDRPVQFGMIGLGRMGANMVRRLLRAGHRAVVFDRSPKAVESLIGAGAVAASSSQDLVRMLEVPRVVWLMVPAGMVDSVIAELVPLLTPGDIVVDGGNSYYVDGIRRATELATNGILTADVGISGGIWGLERGYCQMIGGHDKVIRSLEPLFASLAPPAVSAAPTPGREPGNSTAERGYLHCGPNGAGHFVKMIHNGIEYGLMAAYAEGFSILQSANIGRTHEPADAETTPLPNAAHYQYDFDIGDIAELWRRGSVVTSWLLDLTAAALVQDANLSRFMGSVSDSGEGRWTAKAAIDEGVPAPVLTAALQQRFASRGQSDYANRLISAMRAAFGGHVEKR